MNDFRLTPFTFTFTLALSAVLTLGTSVPGPAGAVALSAQAAPHATGPTRATILALPDRFPADDAVALLVRMPDRDVVVLRDNDLSVEAAAMALSLLERVAAADPTPARGEVMPITGYSMLARPTDRRRSMPSAGPWVQSPSSIQSFIERSSSRMVVSSGAMMVTKSKP